MKVIVFVKATPSSEAGVMPRTELLAEMGQYNEQLVQAGIMKTGEGLKPSKEGVRVRFSGPNRTVIDGPFAETKELVAGFWIWEVRSMQEAIDWVRKCPNPMDTDSDIEIRPVFGFEDFAESDPTGQLEREERELSATIANMTEDESKIRQVISRWSRALEAKDLDGIVADYADDAVLFDAIPPYKVVGKAAIREVWANCLPYFPEQFKSEHRDIVIHVSGDTAIMYGVHHFLPTPADHPCGQTWMRVTVGFRRINGLWKSVHDHVSIPFNPMNSQAWMIRDPNTPDMPDYGMGND
ncbi:MAG: nuclear transport factor 2 family protein [Planctomycetales bacterium]|nr:nuclear transport factor 2 family protein [Planctomycetales bacterium]